MEEGLVHLCPGRNPPLPTPPPAHLEEFLCSYQDPSNEGRWVPLAREEVLQRAWRDKAASPGVLRLQCRVSPRRARCGSRCVRGGGGPGALL